MYELVKVQLDFTKEISECILIYDTFDQILLIRIRENIK